MTIRSRDDLKDSLLSWARDQKEPFTTREAIEAQPRGTVGLEPRRIGQYLRAVGLERRKTQGTNLWSAPNLDPTVNVSPPSWNDDEHER